MKKELHERILDLRNRISLDGDDTIFEEDYLLLDEVLDYIGSNEQRAQEELYNDTVDIYNELEIGIKFKKQEELLESYKKLAEHRLIVINYLLNEIMDLVYFQTRQEFIDYVMREARYYGEVDSLITEDIEVKELENEKRKNFSG